MPQQRGFAGPRRTEQHDGLFGGGFENIGQILKSTAFLPALALRLFALIEQQCQMYETLVQGVTLIGPAFDLGTIVLTESRPVSLFDRG
jgi:hypothetical protein